MNYEIREMRPGEAVDLKRLARPNLLHTQSTPWWNLVAALFFLGVITLGETLGRKAAGGNWHFVLPEGGLVPSAIVALLGGFYPMLGHWYLTERENTQEYRKRMADPAKGAWLLLMVTTLVRGILNKMHPFFSCAVDLGIILLVAYILPFYPFDTFGGRRVREYNKRIYGALVTFSIIALACILSRVSILMRRCSAKYRQKQRGCKTLLGKNPMSLKIIGVTDMML